MTKGDVKAVLFIDGVVYLPLCVAGTWILANKIYGPSMEGQELADAAMLLIVGSASGLAIWLALLLLAIRKVRALPAHRTATAKDFLILVTGVGIAGLAAVIFYFFRPIA
jgi:nitrate reductase gamma subunit